MVLLLGPCIMFTARASLTQKWRCRKLHAITHIHPDKPCIGMHHILQFSIESCYAGAMLCTNWKYFPSMTLLSFSHFNIRYLISHPTRVLWHSPRQNSVKTCYKGISLQVTFIMLFLSYFLLQAYSAWFIQAFYKTSCKQELRQGV